MGVERLQLFVRFCNVCGLFPFRMVLNQELRLFKRFDGHWRHPANWWFASLLIGHFMFLFMFALTGFSMLLSDTDHVLTYVHLVVLVMYLSDMIVLISTPRIFLFHIRHLESAIEILHRIDQTLVKIYRHPCTIIRRTIIGILICLFMALGFLFAMISMIETMILNYGVVFALVFVFLNSLIILQLSSWFLMFHLACYNISYRLDILTSFVGDDNLIQPKNKIAVVGKQNSSLFSTATSNRIKHLRTCGYLFDQICQTCNEIASTFSLSVLAILTILIVMCSGSAFFYFYAMSNLNIPTFIQEAKLTFLGCFMVSIIMVLMILFPAETPITELKRLREKVMEISANDNLENEELMEANVLLMNLSTDRIRLTAGGLFTIGKSLIPTWTSIIITYVVIFVQNTAMTNEPTSSLNTTVLATNNTITRI